MDRDPSYFLKYIRLPIAKLVECHSDWKSETAIAIFFDRLTDGKMDSAYYQLLPDAKLETSIGHGIPRLGEIYALSIFGESKTQVRLLEKTKQARVHSILCTPFRKD
ncbi:hypothetical protein KIN20_026557 [Parelaphostrongylus tenuis]|uniref:Uncharacterized protein n=1 Tax=Parelaphostrongylus tenuis TaxID=148309 RepID=A0AAD5QY82_PARTN|nr:hypothetical protein KIN20_026557 [Parelaphostrongylus tenuis]